MANPVHILRFSFCRALCAVLLLFTLPPAEGGLVEVRANSVAITVRSHQATFREILEAVFKELNTAYKTEERFAVDDVVAERKITSDFVVDSRLALFDKLKELGKCRVEYAENSSLISFLPEKNADPFKTEIGLIP